MGTAQDLFDSLVDYERETALLRSIDALLNWDERTGLPRQAGEYRAEQIAFLTGMVHERSTSRDYGAMLNELEVSELAEETHSDTATIIRQLKRDYDKQKKLPSRLVKELTRASVQGQQAWDESRRASDFQLFKPHLEKLVKLKREQAEAIGYDESIYDPLLDDYEPDEKTSRVRQVLSDLREALVPIVEQIAAATHRPDPSILTREYPLAAQRAFGRQAAAAIGFDFDRGRLDTTSHPFCTELGPHDVRILTRYNEQFFNESFFGTLHEAGHGLYEQGIRPEWYGLPPGKFMSLSIHESQSRLWENLVGRSLPFWEHFFPIAREHFPAALGEVDATSFYGAVNEVQPSLIRVEADEATYNLHIIIRFELEQELLSGELAIDDVPQVWNERYANYLGVTPEHDAIGCLQDVHWGAGLFGYFPTYSLGNLYAAQLYEAAETALGDLNEMFREGDFEPLQKWLSKNVYQRGQCETPAELIERISGKPLSHQPFVAYLRGKLGPIYQIEL